MKLEITNREESITIGVTHFLAAPGTSPEVLPPGARRAFEFGDGDFLVIGELAAITAEMQEPGKTE